MFLKAVLGTATAGLCLLVASPAMAANSLPERMKLLIEQRRATEAYELGLAATDLIGDPLYDYYFGVACVDSGHTMLGALALERFMLSDPSNSLARLELGRAYFKLGDFVRARQEFKSVLASNPPASVATTISRFLAAMEKPNKSAKSAYGGYVELAGGTTSNANSGINGSTIDLPGFGLVTLGKSGVKQGSGLGSVSAGSFANLPLFKGIRAVGAVSGVYRAYSDVPEYDFANIGASLGVGPVSEKLSATVSGVYGYGLLNGKAYRQNYGIAASVRKPLGKKTVITVDGGFQALRYATLNKNRNGRLLTFATGLDRKIKAPGSPIVSIAGYYAREKNSMGRNDFSRKIKGGRLGVTLAPAPKLTVTSSVGIARWVYDGPDLLFGSVRRDWFRSADAAVQFELSKGLTMRFEGQYAQDDSSIPLYKFDQRQIALVLRREWQ
jgi:tetratricopeptide (TPR) repeat protein